MQGPGYLEHGQCCDRAAAGGRRGAGFSVLLIEKAYPITLNPCDRAAAGGWRGAEVRGGSGHGRTRGSRLVSFSLRTRTRELCGRSTCTAFTVTALFSLRRYAEREGTITVTGSRLVGNTAMQVGLTLSTRWCASSTLVPCRMPVLTVERVARREGSPAPRFSNPCAYGAMDQCGPIQLAVEGRIRITTTVSPASLLHGLRALPAVHLVPYTLRRVPYRAAG